MSDLDDLRAERALLAMRLEESRRLLAEVRKQAASVRQHLAAAKETARQTHALLHAKRS